jgi:glutathione S-transferase
MATTLYYAPTTRAARVAFLLEEIGVPYERQTVDRAAGENKTPESREVHPHGPVPALRDDETVVFETATLCPDLAERFRDACMSPALGSPERAAYYQWAVYSVATLEPSLADIWLQRQRSEGERDRSVEHAAVERFRESAAVIGAALKGRSLLGERFRAADVLIGAMLVWGEAMGLLEGDKHLWEYAARICTRPAFARS